MNSNYGVNILPTLFAWSDGVHQLLLDLSAHENYVGLGVEDTVEIVVPPVSACVESGVTCSICTEDIELASPECKLGCGHCFHMACITEWFKMAATCPNCRQIQPMRRSPTVPPINITSPRDEYPAQRSLNVRGFGGRG